MPPWVVLPFLVPLFLTLVLVVLLVGGIVCGAALYALRPTRFAAPFVLFIPTLAALGAGLGSWGLAYLTYERDRTSDLAVLVWVVGYPAGAVLCFLAGVALALLARRRSRAASRNG